VGVITGVGKRVGVEVGGNQTIVAVGVAVRVGVTVASKMGSGIAGVVHAPRVKRDRIAGKSSQIGRRGPNIK
jgi:hypothetical protein